MGGDVLLDRGVRRAFEAEGDRGYPFTGIAPYLKSADLAMANLECPVAESGTPVPKVFSFRADPISARYLKDAGFGALNLANNHSVDYGRGGLVETMDRLKDEGLVHFGAGTNREEALDPAYVMAGPWRVALLGFADMPLEGFLASSENSPTPARASSADIERAIKAARKSADLVVVNVHWGREYAGTATPRQRKLAALMARSGADIVAGHHPHVLQGVEEIGRTRVFYSLGNLVFDHDRRQCRRSVLARVAVSPGGDMKVSALPLIISRSRPAPALGREADEVLADFSPPEGMVWVESDGGWRDLVPAP